ncbi:hypothetical protein MVES1_002060 [Malassezia vespertilionis]|uniref:uncharacterized protein n=1 Tax=Malassezia vespertilionis TaxID=2020962 RepID=UPI0024B1136F|nr:uncharacterized protein MVES1_002060 [Malassezia vespertilionis]WFD06706.1 hypothetical protein MVES1_002060 [Malassezia vespertilionis]
MMSYAEGHAAYMAELAAIIETDRAHERKIVAIGECGLDYDRLHFAQAGVQEKAFDMQLTLAEKVQLPLFLHSRAAHQDFVRILRPHLEMLRRAFHLTTPPSLEEEGSVGVVHSFTGTKEELDELLSLGLYIGVNGCSLKTQENLDVVRHIPLHRIMLETDAPWCEIRATHACAPLLDKFKKAEPALAALYSPSRVKAERWTQTSAVKARNEPCAIGQVAAVVAQLKDVHLQDVATCALHNTQRLLGVAP